MYEIYEMLFDILVPKRIVRGFETFEWARIIRLMLNGLLTYSAVLFLWNGLQFLGHLHRTESRQQMTMSPFWQNAAMAILTANLHLHMAMAG
jgi:hypothetical protein